MGWSRWRKGQKGRGQTRKTTLIFGVREGKGIFKKQNSLILIFKLLAVLYSDKNSPILFIIQSTSHNHVYFAWGEPGRWAVTAV